VNNTERRLVGKIAERMVERQAYFGLFNLLTPETQRDLASVYPDLVEHEWKNYPADSNAAAEKLWVMAMLTTPPWLPVKEYDPGSPIYSLREAYNLSNGGRLDYGTHCRVYAVNPDGSWEMVTSGDIHFVIGEGSHERLLEVEK
jgi:hypothetical protein